MPDIEIIAELGHDDIVDELFNRGLGFDQPTLRAFMDAVHIILQRRLAQAVEWERDRIRVQMRKPSSN